MTFGHQATDWDPGSDADESEAPLYHHSNPRLSYLRITRENKTGLILASGIGLIFASASGRSIYEAGPASKVETESGAIDLARLALTIKSRNAKVAWLSERYMISHRVISFALRTPSD